MVSARKGQVLTLDVRDLSDAMEGVAQVDGTVVYVPGALPGDLVEARVISVQKSHTRALPLRVLVSSPDRIDPPCKVIDRCGGCAVQQLAYPRQRERKARRVREALAAAKLPGTDRAALAAAERPPIGATDADAGEFLYRNVARFPTGERKGELVAGLYSARSHELVPLETCPVQGPLANRILPKLLAWVRRRPIAPYHDEGPSPPRPGAVPQLRAIGLRESFAFGEVLVGLVATRELPAPWGEEIVALEPAGTICGVVCNVNAAAGNRLLGPTTVLLAGRDHVRERLYGVVYQVSLPSFFQVSPRAGARLYAEGRAEFERAGARRVLDVYAGVGAIALQVAAAPGVERIVAVEESEAALRDAETNVRLNAASNVELVRGRAEDVLPGLLSAADPPFDAAVLDPPRKGCSPAVLDALARAAPAPPRLVVYVSCSPESLARDLERLLGTGAGAGAGAGYRLASFRAVDLFPHTAHVEVLATLVRS